MLTGTFLGVKRGISHSDPSVPTGGQRAEFQWGQLRGVVTAAEAAPRPSGSWRRIHGKGTLSWSLKNGYEFFREARRGVRSTQKTQHVEGPRVEKSMTLSEKLGSAPRSNEENGRQRGWRTFIPCQRVLWHGGWLDPISYQGNNFKSN